MCTRNQAFEILKIVYHACDPILGHSIHDAILYGSYARGDFTAESDIDILLTADLTQEQIASQRRAVSGVASTLSLDHDITVSVHVVPLAQFRRYADFLPFYQNVLKEGIRYAASLVPITRNSKQNLKFVACHDSHSGAATEWSLSLSVFGRTDTDITSAVHAFMYEHLSVDRQRF